MNDCPSPVRTTCFLTKYECSRVIGLRLLELQEGEGVQNPLRQAIQEILERRNNRIIRRPLPNGTHEYVCVSKLKHDRFLRGYQLNLESL